MNVLIPKGKDDGFDFVSGHPAWFPCTDSKGNRIKPLIRCNCGILTGIGLHHVHADGKVTASYFHQKNTDHPDGCGWHVFLTLLDYDQGEFLPEK